LPFIYGVRLLKKPQGYDFVYFDWDRTKVTCLRNNEPETFTFPNLRDLIESLDKPTALIGESTFESYNLSERKSVFDLAISNGHIWYGTANRLTYRWRNRFGWVKSDTIDAYVLRIVAEWPTSLSAIRAYKQGGSVQTENNITQFVYDPIDIADLDVADYIGNGSWTRLRKMHVRSPEDFQEYEFERRANSRMRQAEAMEFRRLDDVAKAVRIQGFKTQVLDILELEYTNNKASVNREFTKAFPLINNSVMWAVAFAAEASDSRASFEGLLGAHAHGAKSMLRSQFYHWGWAGNGKGPMNKGASLTDYRRQARQLGSLVDKHSIEL
jgi:hypothetical protein